MNESDDEEESVRDKLLHVFITFFSRCQGFLFETFFVFSTTLDGCSCQVTHFFMDLGIPARKVGDWR